jgi:ATP-dependent exoDNAse (exonuclease V) beta subunit
VPFTPAVAQRPAEQIGVSLHRAASAEAEAQIVTDAIRDAQERDPQGSIAVLVRSRGDLQAVMPALRDAGMAFEAVDIDPLARRPFVGDLMSLTFALLNRADRLSWLALLNTPWCGLSLADITAMVGDDRDGDVWSLLGQAHAQRRLSADGQARIARVQDVLAAALEERGRLPLARWVRGTWIGLGGPACLAGAGELADAEAYLALLDAHASGAELPDRDRFVAAVDKLYASPDANPGVRIQIMTMHKAKGLEWDTVILPGLNGWSGKDDPQLLRWRSPARSGFILAPIKARGEKSDALYDYLGALDELEQRNETMRLVYVAMTRARSQLHLCAVLPGTENGKEPKPFSGSLLDKLWPAIADDFLALTPREVEGAAPGAVQARQRLAGDWQPPAPRPRLEWVRLDRPQPTPQDAIRFDWAREVARHVGTLVHRLLLQMGREGMERWTAERIETMAPGFARELSRLGMPSREQGTAVTRVKRALLSILDDAKGRWVLDHRHRDARGELAVSAVLDGSLLNLVLDRTFVDEHGRRWIVDFKTSAHEGGDREAFLDNEVERYRTQLERYARVWQMREPGPVWLGLYFPLMQEWREWEAATSRE